MNKTEIHNINNDQIDLKEIFKSIIRYKYSIIFITLIFMILSTIFAYIKPSIYSTSTTIALIDKKASTDYMQMALDGGGVNVDNEIQIMKSRYLLQKAFNDLDLNTMYSMSKNYRKIELYKNSPFVVKINFLDDLLYGKDFVLTPINEKSFNLKVKTFDQYTIKGILKRSNLIPYTEAEKIVYNQNHNYGEIINNEWFNISINKIHKLENVKYSFKTISDLSVYNYFRNNLSISQVSRQATILKLSLQDTSALRAKDVLNSIYLAYAEEEVSQKTKEAKLTLDFIDSQLDSLSERLSQSATNLEMFKEKNKVIGLGEQASMTTAKLSEAEAKLQEIQTEINILSNLNQYIKSNQDMTGITVGAVNFADPSLATLLNKLQEEAAKKSSLLVDFTELHPDVEKASQNVASLKRTIKATLKNNLRQLSQRKASISRSIQRFNKSISTLPKQEKELSKLTRHFSIDEKIYSFLLEKKAETAILKSSTISNSRLLDEALENLNPIKPKRTIIVLIGTIIGLILGLALAFLREFMNNTIKNSDEIEKLSSIPIYGVIPNDKNKKTAKLIDEAYRAIRTNLQFLPNHDKSQIIAITSSVSGEGKTTITANLGKILGQANKKVVVLDLDLRKSSIHKEFGIPNNIGISNYLTDQNSLEEVTTHIKDTNVDVITTGTLPPNPSELILTDKMKEFINILKEKYDYVILDTPPVGLVTDALILMNYADIALLVTRASYTRKEFIKNLDRLAKEHNQHTFGMILNGVEIGEKYGYGYGSNYGYGYGNDKYYKNR